LSCSDQEKQQQQQQQQQALFYPRAKSDNNGLDEKGKNPAKIKSRSSICPK